LKPLLRAGSSSGLAGAKRGLRSHFLLSGKQIGIIRHQTNPLSK
jgi:hypothetical protein